MSDFVPPSGPPPPQVPEGWKAVWNDQYQTWFYVNLHTKQSQWDRPETAAFDPNNAHAPQHEAPPNYSSGQNAPVGAGTDTKAANLYSNTPYHSNVAESDEAMARRLQEEENARRTADQSRGASDGYYGAQQNQGYSNGPGYGYPSGPDYSNQQSQQQQQQQQQQQSSLRPGADRGSKSGSFLSKIKDKMAASQGQRPMGQPMMGYGAGGYPPPQQQYGGHPQQGYGRPMGGMPMGGMGGYGHPVKKKGGMGAGGAAALGVGGGLLGGALLMNGIDDMQDDAYDQGFEDGGDMDGGDMGGDF